MENVENKNMGNKCGECEKGCEKGCCHGGCMMSSMCGHGHMMCLGGRRHVARKIIKIALIIIVLCFVFRMGEFTGYMKTTGYGYRIENRGGYGMMRGYDYNNRWGNQVNVPVAPAVTGTTPAPVQ